MRLHGICKKILILLFCMSIFAGCGGSMAEEKLSDLDFTVVSNENIQEDIKKLIDEKKAEPFQLTYTDGTYKYIVVGYGTQETGGYSIQVREVYDTENTICVKTALIGPEGTDSPKKAPSYPFVVIKIQNQDKTVVFPED